MLWLEAAKMSVLPSGADRAARAWPVLDDHRLAERHAELAVERAREHLPRAAGRKRHDNADHLCADLRWRRRGECAACKRGKRRAGSFPGHKPS
jgi:hypothetical protein